MSEMQQYGSDASTSWQDSGWQQFTDGPMLTESDGMVINNNNVDVSVEIDPQGITTIVDTNGDTETNYENFPE
jgi:hypothetical protein